MKRLGCLMVLLVVMFSASMSVEASVGTKRQLAEDYIRRITTLEDGELHIAKKKYKEGYIELGPRKYREVTDIIDGRKYTEFRDEDNRGYYSDQRIITPVVLADGVTTVYYALTNVMLFSDMESGALLDISVPKKVSDLTNEYEVKADTDRASNILGGFAPILEIVLGMLVVITTLGMTVYTAMDTLYIAFPAFRHKTNYITETIVIDTFWGYLLVDETTKGEIKSRWVTDEALYAIEQGSLGGDKSPWQIYLSKRVLNYIMLSILLVILLTNNLTIITGLAVKLISGVIEVLTNIV